METKYYDIHIFFGKGESYSKFYQTNSGAAEADIPAEAFERGFLEKDEYEHNDSCDELKEDEFLNATLGVKATGVDDSTLSIVLTEDQKNIAVDNELIHSPDGKSWKFFDDDLSKIENLKKVHTKL